MTDTDTRKARLKDVSALKLHVRRHGEVPSAAKLAERIGETRQKIARRWGGAELGHAAAWDALYKAAGHERPDGRGDYRRGRELSPDHRRRISEAVQRHWEQRQQGQED